MIFRLFEEKTLGNNIH